MFCTFTVISLSDAIAAPLSARPLEVRRLWQTKRRAGGFPPARRLLRYEKASLQELPLRCAAP